MLKFYQHCFVVLLLKVAIVTGKQFPSPRIVTGETCFPVTIGEDGKVDLRLQKSGFQQIVGESENLLVRLQKAGGFLATTDKTPAEEIYSIYGISKKMYKKAVGDLYKKRLISIEEEGIRLIKK